MCGTDDSVGTVLFQLQTDLAGKVRLKLSWTAVAQQQPQSAEQKLAADQQGSISPAASVVP
jgi:hypothetical protein